MWDYLTATGDSGFYLIVNDEELVKQMEVTTGNRVLFSQTLQAARAQFLPQVTTILYKIVKDAADSQEDGAFPIKFRTPLYQAIQALPQPNLTGSAPHLVTITLPNLYELLGGEDEYAAAFHHGALLNDYKVGSRGDKFVYRQDMRADIRYKTYDEDDLATESAGRRYRYWKALYEGKKSFTVTAGTGEFGVNAQTGKFYERRSDPIEVPIAGSWEETVDARLQAWKRVMPGGAPQWLLLEYGQPKWAPKINITDTTLTSNVKVYGTRQVYGGPELKEEGLVFSRIKADVRAVKQSVTYKTPANISSMWVNALAQEWTAILASVWKEQIDKFNSTSTGIKFDRKSARLRSPITGRFLKFATPESLFRTRSARSMESLTENARAQGRLGALEYLSRNRPFDLDEIMSDTFWGDDDII